MDIFSNLFKKGKTLHKQNKGELDPIHAGIGLIILVVLGYIMFPIITGVQNSTTAPTNTALLGAYNNYTVSVAGAITMFGISPIVYGAVIVLGILMLLAKKTA